MHLLSQPVQEELATFAMAIETSTLDVERKHRLDRHSEARRVASVAKASRDGFVRHWRMQPRAATPTRKERKQQRADKDANKVSLALEQRPDLFPQARGRLRWEKRKPKNRKSLRSDRPLQRLLREYVEEHRDKLEVEARQRHSRAQKGLPRHVTSWPLSKAEWVRW